VDIRDGEAIMGTSMGGENKKNKTKHRATRGQGVEREDVAGTNLETHMRCEQSKKKTAVIVQEKTKTQGK